MRAMRALSYATASLLLFAVFEGCSNNGDNNIAAPAGPPTVSIASISLGHGVTGGGGDTSTLVCDHTIGVTLATSNWKLLPPGFCGETPQCGQVRVSLLDKDGNKLSSPEYAATLSVDLNLDALVDFAKLPALPAKLQIEAELVNDSGDVFDAKNGGNSVALQFFDLDTIQNKGDCPELSGAAGAGAAASEGGAGDAANEGGAAGFGGMPDFGQVGAAGSAGEGGAGGSPG